MALLCSVLVLAITTLSAFMRLSKTGLGCEPWPQCYAQGLYEASQALASDVPPAVAAARIAHRVAAIAALLVIIGMVMTTFSRYPMMLREGRMVLGLLALAVFLAVLGRWTAQARVPAVVLGNLLGGFAMFALSWCLVRATSARAATQAVDPRLARWAAVGVVLTVIQVALGGLVNALHAGISCPELLHCDMAAASWQSLNPWHEPTFDAAGAINRGGALVQVLHRAGAVLVSLILLPIGVAAWRTGRGAGAALVALVAAQLVLGALLITRALPLPVALAHNLLAALLLAVLAVLAGVRKASNMAGAREASNVAGVREVFSERRERRVSAEDAEKT